MRVAGNEIIVAEELIADARAVTRRTRILDRRFFARAMSREETAARERGTTDVALSTRAVAFRAMIVERFFQRGRIDVRADGFEVCPVTVLVDVQTRRGVLRLFVVAETARLFGILAWIGDYVLVRDGFVRCRAVSIVASDATQFAVR